MTKVSLWLQASPTQVLFIVKKPLAPMLRASSIPQIYARPREWSASGHHHPTQLVLLVTKR